jgi:hypothetical protein
VLESGHVTRAALEAAIFGISHPESSAFEKSDLLIRQFP